MVYCDYDFSERADFSDLVGKTLKSVERGRDTITLETEGGETYRQIYYEDCCASCDIEDVCGDLNDLIGTPILQAEESSSSDMDKWPEGAEKPTYTPESFTWTFYKLGTIKGSVTIRWYGSSNGYYSERATFERLRNEGPMRTLNQGDTK